MQIHELNTKTPSTSDYLALDTGTQTYKANVGDLKPAYSSSDTSLSPTTWTDFALLSSNSKFTYALEIITKIAKNVRYFRNLIGSGSFSNVASTIAGAIGNTSLPTTATSLSGAIAEHEGDISTINGKLAAVAFDLTRNTTNTTSGNGKGIYDKATGTVRLYFQWAHSSNVASGTTLFTIPSGYRPPAQFTGYGLIRTSENVPLPATYTISTAGAITQTASNSARGGFAVIEYIL